MNLRKIITVGRSESSDIYLDEKFVYASKRHGIIFYDGNQLMYRDMSSNGTMINNKSVKHRTVPIRRGDIILVAGRYQLDWNKIDTFLPQRPIGTAFAQQEPSGGWQGSIYAPAVMDTNKWNWGAMGVYPVWGLFNGCWWAALVGLLVGLLLFPLPNIVFGYYGTRWAWRNKQWISPQEFQRVQTLWEPAGIATMCCATLFYLWWIWIYADYVF